MLPKPKTYGVRTAVQHAHAHVCSHITHYWLQTTGTGYRNADIADIMRWFLLCQPAETRPGRPIPFTRQRIVMLLRIDRTETVKWVLTIRMSTHTHTNRQKKTCSRYFFFTGPNRQTDRIDSLTRELIFTPFVNICIYANADGRTHGLHNCAYAAVRFDRPTERDRATDSPGETHFNGTDTHTHKSADVLAKTISEPIY